MGDKLRSAHADWVPVTIRLKVPVAVRGAEVFKLVAESWATRGSMELDDRYGAIPVRPAAPDGGAGSGAQA
jgi:hypothetical protein